MRTTGKDAWYCRWCGFDCSRPDKDGNSKEMCPARDSDFCEGEKRKVPRQSKKKAPPLRVPLGHGEELVVLDEDAYSVSSGETIILSSGRELATVTLPPPRGLSAGDSVQVFALVGVVRVMSEGKALAKVSARSHATFVWAKKRKGRAANLVGWRLFVGGDLA